MITERTSPEMQKAEGTWKKFKGKVKEAWGDLTDDELDRYEGKVEQLVGRIQEKTGEQRDTIRKKINEFANEAKYRT